MLIHVEVMFPGKVGVTPPLRHFPRHAELGFATILQHQALSGTEGVMKTAQMSKEIFEELGDRTGSFAVGPQRSKEFYETLKTCPIMSMFTM